MEHRLAVGIPHMEHRLAVGIPHMEHRLATCTLSYLLENGGVASGLKPHPLASTT